MRLTFEEGGVRGWGGVGEGWVDRNNEGATPRADRGHWGGKRRALSC